MLLACETTVPGGAEVNYHEFKPPYFSGLHRFFPPKNLGTTPKLQAPGDLSETSSILSEGSQILGPAMKKLATWLSGFEARCP